MKKELAIEIMNNLLKELKLNPNELALALGLKRTQGLYDILNHKKKVGISIKMADNICNKFPNINKCYLLTGEGEMLKSTTSNSNDTSDEIENWKNKYVALLEKNAELSSEIIGLYKEIRALKNARPATEKRPVAKKTAGE